MKEIKKELEKCSELDGQGILWWGKFKDFVTSFDPEPKDPIDFDALITLINRTFDREFRKVSPQVKSKYRARLRDGYTKEDIMRAIMAVKDNPYHIETDYLYATPTFFSQEKTLEKYGVKKSGNSDNVNTNQPVN